MPQPSVRIRGGYWAERQAINACQAIFHQWEQLEQTRCIDNFRLAAGQIAGFRQGLFFADSDAYKWLEAASRILASGPNPALQRRVDALADLLEAAQAPDGYLFTYNQIHFPGQRWVNLQLEHELYCHGHLIEAGIAHHLATGQPRALAIARRAADLLVRDFMEAPPSATDGHEEIEIALIRLSRHTESADYLELARRFLERRGRISSYGWHFARQAARTLARMGAVERARRREQPPDADFHLPPRNPHRVPLLTWPRLVYSLLSGHYNQQQAPLRAQTAPVGHAVRFTYLATAAAMLAQESGDPTLGASLEQAWDRMVRRRMYVTGGIGSLPLIEGFGRDHELDPETAYAESCAAIGSLLWNREMARLTSEACYDDLFEWQLYNAASPGMGLDGCSYLYNNPLRSRGHVVRRPWYDVPCCPSNLSRLWASLPDHLYDHHDSGEVRILQYASSDATFDWGSPVRLHLETGLPWTGEVRLSFNLPRPRRFRLALRLPSWAAGFSARLNGEPADLAVDDVLTNSPSTASGVAPYDARWLRLERRWRSGDLLDLEFEMPIRLLRQDRRLPGCAGMSAVARGPILYCLEDVDNSGDIHAVTLDPRTLSVVHDHGLLGGVHCIRGRAVDGSGLTFIPYALWGNRGDSCMTVFVRTTA